MAECEGWLNDGRVVASISRLFFFFPIFYFFFASFAQSRRSSTLAAVVTCAVQHVVQRCTLLPASSAPDRHTSASESLRGGRGQALAPAPTDTRPHLLHPPYLLHMYRLLTCPKSRKIKSRLCTYHLTSSLLGHTRASACKSFSRHIIFGVTKISIIYVRFC